MKKFFSRFLAPLNKKNGSRSVREVAKNLTKVRQKKSSKPRRVFLDQEGVHHNLKTIYSRVNHEYFEGKIDLPFTWNGSRTRRPRVRFRFGSYNLRTQHIKVHRMLDHPEVPECCVAYILYHEILHHVLPPIRRKRGVRHIHHEAFVLREKEFRDYALAQNTLKKIVKGPLKHEFLG